MTAVIDAHVHLWDLALEPQPWAEPFPVLHRSFLVTDLQPVLAAHGVDAAIVVQAGDTTTETLGLLELADQHAIIAGVVGWADLASSEAPSQIARLRGAPGGSQLVGLRHQLQLEPDPYWLARNQVRTGLKLLGSLGLCFDIVVSASQLSLVIETMRALPETRFVLDHAGKPPLAGNEDLAQWRHDTALLAALPNAAVKLSGLVTETSRDVGAQRRLDPVIDHILDSFGPDRVMIGSDWPVCLLTASYGEVQATMSAALDRSGEHEREDLLAGTARRWYLGRQT